MDFVSNTDALIFGTPDDRGGDPSTVRISCSHLFGEEPVHPNDIYFRPENRTTEFWTLKCMAGKRYLNREVCVLTSIGVRMDVNVAPDQALKAAHVVALKNLVAKAKDEDKERLRRAMALASG